MTAGHGVGGVIELRRSDTGPRMPEMRGLGYGSWSSSPRLTPVAQASGSSKASRVARSTGESSAPATVIGNSGGWAMNRGVRPR